MSYPFTCPLIDDQINEMEGIIYNDLEFLVEHIKKDLVSQLSTCFEVARESNSDMRSHYEYLIKEKESKIDYLEKQEEELKNRVSDLENRIWELENE